MIKVKMNSLFAEAVIVGIVTMIAFNRFFIRILNSYPNSIEIFAFVMGCLIHLGFERIGANKWYCKNGYACLNV